MKIGHLLGKGMGHKVRKGDWHGTKVAIKIPFRGNRYRGTLSENEYDRMGKEVAAL